MWDLSCPDWEDRILSGRPLIPDLPLFKAEADMGLAFFDELQLPDVTGTPKMRTACGQWFRDLVRVAHGSYDPVAEVRYIRDIFAMLPKGQSKTTYSAGLMLSAMLMNKRPKGEALFVGPTQAISDTAYDKAVGMIELSPDLKRRFKTRDHVKTIEDLENGSELRVKTFDTNILTGSILFMAMVDELHLLGKNAHTAKVLRQIRGGLEKTPEGLLIFTTTQSDEAPAGAFKDELKLARRIRDGKMAGKDIRPMLPVLYEFPPDIAKDQQQWQDPENWGLVMPNMGRSVKLPSLISDWNSERDKGPHAVKIWASQHLNIEIGVGISDDGWAGAEFWKRRADKLITLKALIDRCEGIVIGIDGGGQDDLYGVTVAGRESREVEVDAAAAPEEIQEPVNGKKRFKRWMSWSHAWAYRIVLERRKSIASVLLDFEKDGDLTILDNDAMVGGLPADIAEVIDIITMVRDAGLLWCVAVDPARLGELLEALEDVGITQDNKDLGYNYVIGAPQGIALMNAGITAERKLANGTLTHAEQPMMDWCVGNLKVERTSTAFRFTKQNTGDAKIDPAMALFNCVTVLVTNPDTRRSVYEDRGPYVF